LIVVTISSPLVSCLCNQSPPTYIYTLSLHDALPILPLSKMNVNLYQSGPVLLAGMSDQASAKCLEYLRELGVNVFLNTRVKSYRSEEHTSELQSRENLVCRLLLDKKTYRSTGSIDYV